MHELIKGASAIAITSHYRPDGDSVGSAIALRLALLGMEKKTADIYVDDEMPDKLSYLADIKTIANPNSIVEGKTYDLLIILDASSEDRIGEATKLRAVSKQILCIDHHMVNQIEADEKIVDMTSASTGEILYTYFTEYKIQITKEIAEALYTSIATDTGCFMHSSTTSRTHAIVAELMKNGFDTEHINYIHFKVYDRRAIQGMAYVLRNIKFFCGGKIATVFIPYKMLKRFNLKNEADRLKNMACEASGVKAGAFILEEIDGTFHVSLRSHGEIDVAAVAKNLSGGGHKNASGFTFKGEYKDLHKQIIAQLEKIV